MIDAEVQDVIYMGDILRTRLRVAETDDFVMKSRNTLGQTRLQPGQKIKIGWHHAGLPRAPDPVQ
ncbi:TOBE domain-containing protein [Paracoccus sp. DMF-8]|uniref:TOBE domain-containing protein n=1 Tax=Paracoccus sp. DMF-8 TaxID=3019445 RepID=UPI0023E84502|nr:TOBE domain-containing protein [Paracoccus sp. DMF-8]MDF3605918.1 TOBE domain-containing protein [Paracoccus sp. DMF-8]